MLNVLSKLKKIFSLGKGLESLIPVKGVNLNVPEQEQDNVFYIEVSKVKPNPDQPRKDFDERGIEELAKSIKKYGILQPILVAKIEKETQKGIDVEYQIIAGERRYRAALAANLPQVPVIVKDVDPDPKSLANLELALVENIQRKNLNPIEEAEAFAKLVGDFEMSYEDVAKQVGKSRESIINSIRLLKLPDEVKEAVRVSKLSMGHARALLAIKDLSKQNETFKKVLAQGISVREVEVLANQLGVHEKNKTSKIKKKESRFVGLEKNLSDILGTAVCIRLDNGIKGKIMIRFSDHEHLNTIAKTILD